MLVITRGCHSNSSKVLPDIFDADILHLCSSSHRHRSTSRCRWDADLFRHGCGTHASAVPQGVEGFSAMETPIWRPCSHMETLAVWYSLNWVGFMCLSNHWLVVWNIFIFFHILGSIIPIILANMFQRDWNHQPVIMFIPRGSTSTILPCFGRVRSFLPSLGVSLIQLKYLSKPHGFK